MSLHHDLDRPFDESVADDIRHGCYEDDDFDHDPEECACGGSGWVPGWFAEDQPCPYHREEPEPCPVCDRTDSGLDHTACNRAIREGVD